MQMNADIARQYDELLKLKQADTRPRQRRALVERLKDAGAPAPSLAVREVLREYKKVIHSPKAVVIGSTAFETYCGRYGIADIPVKFVATNDVDVLTERPLKQERPDDRLPLTSDKGPTRTHVSGAGIDFQVPAVMGARNPHTVMWVERFDTYAHIMPPDIQLLLKAPALAVLLDDAGILVQVPAPAHYALHKLRVSEQRTKQVKIEKDRGQAQILLEQTARTDRRGLNHALQDFIACSDNLVQHFALDALTKLSSQAPAFNAWKQHALKALHR